MQNQKPFRAIQHLWDSWLWFLKKILYIVAEMAMIISGFAFLAHQSQNLKAWPLTQTSNRFQWFF